VLVVVDGGMQVLELLAQGGTLLACRLSCSTLGWGPQGTEEVEVVQESREVAEEGGVGVREGLRQGRGRKGWVGLGRVGAEAGGWGGRAAGNGSTEKGEGRGCMGRQAGMLGSSVWRHSGV
jgi:hypothetical protein